MSEHVGHARADEDDAPAVHHLENLRQPRAGDRDREPVTLGRRAREKLDEVDAVERAQERVEREPAKVGEPPPGPPGQRLAGIGQARRRLPDEERFHAAAGDDAGAVFGGVTTNRPSLRSSVAPTRWQTRPRVAAHFSQPSFFESAASVMPSVPAAIAAA